LIGLIFIAFIHDNINVTYCVRIQLK